MPTEAPLEDQVTSDPGSSALPSHPVTAPGGWSSLLTWRSPSGPSSRQAQAETQRAFGPAHLVERDQDDAKHVQSKHTRSSSRSRAPIPFHIAESTMQQEGSPSSSRHSTDVFGGYSSPDELPKHRSSSAYGTLSRVKAKDRVVSASIREPTASSIQVTSQFTQPSLQANSAENNSWVAWGTTRLRTTVSQGVLSSFFTNSSVEDRSHAGPSSPKVTTESRTSEKPNHQTGDPHDVDWYVDRIISFAGIDSESRAIVTLSAPSLPPASEVSHDLLLQRILSRTSPLVETPAGYTLVLFASGAQSTKGEVGPKTAWPGWTWCWKAWRSLERSYRKNLKKLVIVHPTFFTRTFVRLISTGSYFVSPKFARKIVQCEDLKTLEAHVPLRQLDIPSEVLIWELRSAGRNSHWPPHRDDGPLPIVVQDVQDVLYGSGQESSLLRTQGLFRISPASALTNACKLSYQLQLRPNLKEFVSRDPHIPCALLKDYLRNMDPPLIPPSMYPLISACPTSSQEQQIIYIHHTIFPALGSSDRRALLKSLLHLLHDVSSHKKENLMDASNLAIVVAPSLIRSQNALQDIAMCTVSGTDPKGNTNASSNTMTLVSLVAFCIDSFHDLYSETYGEYTSTPSQVTLPKSPARRSSGGVDRQPAFAILQSPS